jgi:biotin synthase
LMYADAPRADLLAEILSDDRIDEALFARADDVKKSVFGNKIFVRGIIEFSNYCGMNCSYCGIGARVNGVVRYRMTPDELVDCAVSAAQVYETVILQSGEDRWYTAEMLGEIVSRIKQKKHCTVTLSIGERSYDEYRIMREGGADRFLLKHETANASLYARLHQTTLKSRLSCQESLSTLGYELGSGFMVGLPGQGDAELAEDLLLLKRMNVKMAGIGPFIAHPDTLFGKASDGDPNKTLKVLALARLLLPHCHLPSTTALNVKDGMVNALHTGANVVMQKATPFAYRDLYDIYPGRDVQDVSLQQQRAELDEELHGMNFVPI